MTRHPARRVAIGLCFLISLLIGPFTFAANAAETIQINLGRSQVLPNSMRVESVFIADPDIADVSPGDDGAVFIFGRATGETSMILSVADGAEMRHLNYTIRVIPNVEELESAVKRAYPQENIVLQGAKRQLIVRGQVKDDATRQGIVSLLESGVSGGEVVDGIRVSGSNLVRLQIKLIEVNSAKAADYGLDLSLSINGLFFDTTKGGLRFGFDQSRSVGQNSVTAAVDFLIDNGIGTLVEETSLATVMGESVRFSAGSEFPIPRFSATSDTFDQANFSVDYRFVGSRIDFTPNRAPGAKVRLAIRSEVSAIQPQTSEINGNNFPNLSTRELDTKVELDDRQSFILAGLTRNASNVNLLDSRGDAVSDVYNTAFGRDRVEDQRLELIIVVTPILCDVAPTAREDLLPPSAGNLEYLLRHKVAVAEGAGASALRAAAAQAGFTY